MKVISASRRTDIPAFYADWFLRRVKEGFCQWRNPFNQHLHEISLRPEEVGAIVFWTRNPTPLIPHLAFLKSEGYKMAFHFTVNDYPNFLESGKSDLDRIAKVFGRMAEIVSPEMLFWRYDPIVLSESLSAEFHVARVKKIGERLLGFSTRCLTSFVQFYGKTRRRFEKLEKSTGQVFWNPDLPEKVELLGQLQEICQSKGFELEVCCDPDLSNAGFSQARCIDKKWLEQLNPLLIGVLKGRPTRKGCGCFESFDIGAYDTCGFGCEYCYATNSTQAARKNLLSHDPTGPLLKTQAGLP